MDKQERQGAITVAAGVAAHALLNHNGGYTPAELASLAFDYAEAFVAEAERRAKLAGVML